LASSSAIGCIGQLARWRRAALERAGYDVIATLAETHAGARVGRGHETTRTG